MCLSLPLVCLLHKSLCDLKQVSRHWYTKLSDFLLLHDFKQANYDHSQFLKHVGQNTTVILVFVDDIILVGNDIDEIRSIVASLYQTPPT